MSHLVSAMDLIQKLNSTFLLFIIWTWLSIVAVASYKVGISGKLKGTLNTRDFSSNILALLAFIMGFSFSMAVSRYEVRKTLAVDEANAIGTAYLQSQVLQFKNPQRVKNLYLGYVDLRINAYLSEHPENELKKADHLESELWNELAILAKSSRGALESAYMKSLNELFDTASSRKFALMKFLPSAFYFLIVLLASVSICILNYDRGIDLTKDHWKIGLFIFLFGIIFIFIFDLDHSRKGMILVGQDPLIELRSKM